MANKDTSIIFTLSISREKILSLSNGSSKMVSHPATKRWIGFFNKRPKYVRFFDHKYCTSKIFKVVGVYKLKQLGEDVILIKVQRYENS